MIIQLWRISLGLLKQEIYYGHVFSVHFEELEQVIANMDSGTTIRNESRQKLNWMSPIQFRLNYQNN